MRKAIGPFDVFSETMDKLAGDGILLVAGDPPNPMTIGWGTIGIIWSRPVFQVLVRPTRFTFERMEASSCFSVNMLDDRYSCQLSVCGTESGRDADKVKKCSFTMKPGELPGAIYIEESYLHFECRIIHKRRLDPQALDPAIISRYYPLRDFHMVYYGEIAGVYAR
jgi:flavin reductase (DIM6/NTAB) family NADH-FMN oxidoreductase RutF